MREIQLTRGKVARVDDADFAELNLHRWYADEDGRTWRAVRFVRTDGRRVKTYMHRVIMQATKSQNVDHVDGDGLNCIRSNLRIATRRQNSQHRVHVQTGKTSKFKGVYLDHGRWRSIIYAGPLKQNGKARPIHLGCFDNELDAAKAYDEAAERYYGEWKATNISSY